jgi:hypothetical protein
MSSRLGGYSIFDDKGEVKQLVESRVRASDPDVTIDSMRKIDFKYIFMLAKGPRRQELELNRDEIDASWGWRSGSIDETLQKKIENTIAGL